MPIEQMAMVAIVLADFARARRLLRLTAAFGQPATQASSTSPNVAKRSRLAGAVAPPCARNASSSWRSRSASTRSVRSNFRRDPSGNRTHAVHRCFDSFHRTDGLLATFNWLREGCHPQAPGARQAVDLRRWRGAKGNRTPDLFMPCTRRTIQHVQQRAVEATHVRSYPTAVQRRNRVGKTSRVPMCARRSVDVAPRPAMSQAIGNGYVAGYVGGTQRAPGSG